MTFPGCTDIGEKAGLVADSKFYSEYYFLSSAYCNKKENNSSETLSGVRNRIQYTHFLVTVLVCIKYLYDAA